MTIFIGTENKPKVKNSNEKNNIKTNDTTKSLNFSSVSKHLSFNEGNKEGYYQVRPKAIRPSRHNPRPDWVIDDSWLIEHVGINMDDVYEQDMDSDCLVKIEEIEEDGILKEITKFPKFEDLKNNPSTSQKKEYEFLVSLAKSIKEVGQIQPIEIETDTESGLFIVLEGHLRRLATILGRIKYIKAIRNESLGELSVREKVGRQITENSIRSNISLLGNFRLAKQEFSEQQGITARDLASRLKISKNVSSVFLKLIKNEEKYHELVFKAIDLNLLTSRSLIKVASFRRKDKQEQYILSLFKKNKIQVADSDKVKPRGETGRRKTTASFKLKSEETCKKAGKILLSRIPELRNLSNIKEVNSIKDMDILLKSLERFLSESPVEE